MEWSLRGPRVPGDGPDQEGPRLRDGCPGAPSRGSDSAGAELARLGGGRRNHLPRRNRCSPLLITLLHRPL